MIKINKKKIMVIIGIVVLLLVLYFVLNNHKDKMVSSDTPLESPVAETIMINDKKVEIKNSLQDVTIILPKFQNLDNEFQKYINAKIETELSEETVYQNATLGLEEEEIGLFTYDVNYNRYNCGDYVSIVMNQYIHLGEGRPRIQKKCYVIHAKENTLSHLSDVVTNKDTYQEVIMEEINKQARSMEIELVGGNGLLELSDTQAFYIKDNKLIIYFEASEIAATAVGELEFEMPFKMVNDKFDVDKE